MNPEEKTMILLAIDQLIKYAQLDEDTHEFTDFLQNTLLEKRQQMILDSFEKSLHYGYEVAAKGALVALKKTL